MGLSRPRGSCVSNALSHFALLQQNHAVIPGEQPAEHHAAVAIAKTLLPDVMVKES